LTLWTILRMRTGFFNSRSWITKSESLVTFDPGSQVYLYSFLEVEVRGFRRVCFSLSFHPFPFILCPPFGQHGTWQRVRLGGVKTEVNCPCWWIVIHPFIGIYLPIRRIPIADDHTADTMFWAWQM
jgi:hypothetical protein